MQQLFKVEEISPLVEIQPKGSGSNQEAYYQNKFNEEQSNKVNYYSKSDKLLEALPSEFTEEDVVRIGEMKSNYARVQCWRWVQDRKVVKSGKGKKARYSK